MKKKFLLHFAMFWGFAVFAACLNEPQLPTLANDYEIEKAIPLVLNEKVSVSSDNLHLSFIKVIDESRCPETWKCLWEGEAEIELKIEKGELSEIIRLKYQGGNCTGCGDAVSALGYTFKLEKLSPYPDETFFSTSPMNFENYKIIIRVTREEEAFS
ncbi:MAG: hypothetical protein HC803_10230 [Saprospiraceae bacterium]|nr:hypothetical protein [Saprospiraceae bacterium]